MSWYLLLFLFFSSLSPFPIVVDDWALGEGFGMEREAEEGTARTGHLFLLVAGSAGEG